MMRKSPQKVHLLIGVALVPILAIAALSTIAGAEQPQTIKERAIGTQDIIKVKSLEVLEKVVRNNDIDIVAEKSADKVVFKAINKANKDSDFKIDLWKISVDGAVVDIAPLPISVADDGKLKAKDLRILTEFRISDYFDALEEYPGLYEITLLGYDRESALAKVQDPSDVIVDGEIDEDQTEYTLEDLAVYKIKSRMIIGYDQEQIKANGNVLKAKNAEVAIDGLDPFVVESGENRKVVVYLVNNENHPVSANVHHSSVTFMNAELTKAVGSERIGEFSPDQCTVLMPGELLQLTKFTIGKNVFPLGHEDNGLSKIMNDGKSARSGTYIAEVQGSTQACSIDGEDLPGMTFESMVAFEVN